MYKKSMLLVQNCCFTNLDLLLFAVLVTVPIVIAQKLPNDNLGLLLYGAK